MHGFYPHASKDPAELRYEFLKLMAQEIDFSARVVVGRKIPAIYQQRHNEQPREFYADLMSHLLKYSGKIDPLILDVAERGSSTSNLNLQHAVDIAQQRSRRGTVTHELRNTTNSTSNRMITKFSWRSRLQSMDGPASVREGRRKVLRAS